MAIIVNTNMSALKTRTNLSNATNGLNSALERMSTGYKINRAKDDAAGLFVASGLETQIRGSKIAQNNISTGNNVLQMVEGDLDVMMDNLQRIRDLAVQASNSVYSADAMKAMGSEINARLTEIDRISKASNFNGIHLLDASDTNLQANGLRLQVGADADATSNAIYLKEMFQTATDSTTLGANPTIPDGQDATVKASMNLKTATEAVFGPGVASPQATAAAAYIAVVDKAIDDISNKKALIGATMNRLESAEASLTTTIENATAAKSTIMDADIAEESAEFTKQQILQQSSAALLVQANQLPSIALSLVQ